MKKEHINNKRTHFLKVLTQIDKTTPKNPTTSKAFFHSLILQNPNAINETLAEWQKRHDLRKIINSRLIALSHDLQTETPFIIPFARAYKEQDKTEYKYINKKTPLQDISFFPFLKLLYKKHTISRKEYKTEIKRIQDGKKPRLKIQEQYSIYLKTLTKYHKGRSSISALTRQEHATRNAHKKIFSHDKTHLITLKERSIKRLNNYEKHAKIKQIDVFIGTPHKAIIKSTIAHRTPTLKEVNLYAEINTEYKTRLKKYNNYTTKDTTRNATP